jgi:ATP-dependent DNA helicase RecG
VFIAEPTTEDAQQRMSAIAGTTDGFEIAEADLLIRGMGQIIGTQQSGLPPLRVARIPDDMELLQMARRDARDLVQADPKLTEPAHELMRKRLVRQYGDYLDLGDVG